MTTNSQAFIDIARVNRRINNRPFSRTVIELYGAPDFWEIAQGSEPCVDCAMAKRQLLLREGFAPALLRLAVVFTETPEGQRRLAKKQQAQKHGDTFAGDHAVLLAKVPEGEFLLDDRYMHPLMLPQQRYVIDRLQIAGSHKWEQWL